MGLLDSMAEDSAKAAARLPSDDELQTISDLANEQLRLEAIVQEKSQELDDLKSQLSFISEVTLPNAIEAVGIQSVTLLDKTKVSIKEKIFAGITEPNKVAAFEWLENTGNDGIIKNEVKVPFGKGQDSEAKELAALLDEKGFSFSQNRSVHPQTLAAFVRKQMEEGSPVPSDIFSVHVKKSALIELPKVRK